MCGPRPTPAKARDSYQTSLSLFGGLGRGGLGGSTGGGASYLDLPLPGGSFPGGSFPNGTLPGGAVPAEVDLRGFDGPVRDQGQVGVCWAHALSSVMDNGARRAGFAGTVMSALHVIAVDAWDDLWRGDDSDGLTVEQLWPYDGRKACAFNDNPREVWCQEHYGVTPGSWRSDPRLVAEKAAADGSHQYRFYDVHHLESRPANTEQVALVLASGHALWAELDFNRAAWSYSELQDGVFSDYEVDRDYGHAVQLTGYRAVGGERQFLIKNSWGTDWGHGGYAWMSESLLRKHLMQAFYLDVASSRDGKLPNGGLQLPVPIPGLGQQIPGLQIPGLQIPGLQIPGLQIPGMGQTPNGGQQPGVQIPGLGQLPGLQGLQVPPLPAPSPPLATGGCAAGQVPDAVTGLCIAPCPSGKAPTFGVCVE
jgi:hypothetical protein